jgi:hypothetical protein
MTNELLTITNVKVSLILIKDRALALSLRLL